MRHDAFSRFHPVVNFIFFAGAIGFGVVFQHPAYLLAGIVCSVLYYLLLRGRKGWKLIGGMVPVFLLIALLNPLINTRGRTVLLTLFGRPYTLEALCYGMALGGMFVLMMAWFGCYNAVLTSDKFICLFGRLIPALSLLLVMVLRMIPGFSRKAAQITVARRSIGRGGSGRSGWKERVSSGMMSLSALTDWALEGSIVTADSMRARGYGCAKRTSFQIYRMTLRDWVAAAIELLLAGAVLAAASTGAASAGFIPRLAIPHLTWGYAFYWAFLLIPVVIEGKEALQWRILRSKI